MVHVATLKPKPRCAHRTPRRLQPSRPLGPKIQLSKLVNSLKGISARLLRKEYDSHIRRYPWGGHFRSGSYFAGSCGGTPLTVVKQDIENHKRPT
ncbi:transposase [Streptomyces sp. NPDC005548]|uniref:transposase n=1 Tax=Streptomyces sp. NPDC005548 TaxID=3364724 RepID=UPI0036984284